jgi:hypothetical protein
MTRLPFRHTVSILGLEPKTFGLKDHCSTFELYILHLIGIEPITSRYERAILPFNYRYKYKLMVIGIEPTSFDLTNRLSTIKLHHLE